MLEVCYVPEVTKFRKGANGCLEPKRNIYQVSFGTRLGLMADIRQ